MSQQQQDTQQAVRICTGRVRPAITAMEVGETLSFPAIRLRVVQVQCSSLGFELDRRYRTRANRENRTVEVTRER